MTHLAKHAAIISFMLTTASFLNFKTSENPVYITGHIIKNTKDTSVNIAHLLIVIEGNEKLLARALTDSQGRFKITFVPGKEKSFDFYCSGTGIGKLLLASMTTFESDTPEIDFYIPAKPKRNKQDKVICPKCRHADEVCEIVYGASYIARVTGKSGDTTYSPIHNGKYYEDCIVQPAKYFCKRDKVKF